jgi:hypothetical protein
MPQSAASRQISGSGDATSYSDMLKAILIKELAAPLLINYPEGQKSNQGSYTDMLEQAMKRSNAFQSVQGGPDVEGGGEQGGGKGPDDFTPLEALIGMYEQAGESAEGFGKALNLFGPLAMPGAGFAVKYAGDKLQSWGKQAQSDWDKAMNEIQSWQAWSNLAGAAPYGASSWDAVAPGITVNGLPGFDVGAYGGYGNI